MSYLKIKEKDILWRCLDLRVPYYARWIVFTKKLRLARVTIPTMSENSKRLMVEGQNGWIMTWTEKWRFLKRLVRGIA